MKVRLISVVTLLSVLVSVGLTPAGANNSAPRRGGLATMLGLTAMKNQLASAPQSPVASVDVPTAWQTKAAAPLPERAGGTLNYLRDAQSNHNLWYMGGVINIDGGVTGQVDKYNLVRNQWTANVTTMPIPVGGHCAVTLGRTIYAIGGTDIYQINVGVQALNTDTMTWRTNFDPFPSSLPNGLATHGCGVIGNVIYVFGGGDPISLVASGLTLRFDPSRPTGQQWTQLAYLMPHARAGLGYTTDPAARLIYTVGGTTEYDPTTGLPNEVPYVEVFSPTSGWTTKPDLPFNRTGGALFLYQNKTRLVFTGGGVLSTSNRTYMCTLPACSTWTQTSTMNEARTTPAYTSILNYLYVVGGIKFRIFPPAILFLSSVELGP